MILIVEVPAETDKTFAGNSELALRGQPEQGTKTPLRNELRRGSRWQGLPIRQDGRVEVKELEELRHPRPCQPERPRQLGPVPHNPSVEQPLELLSSLDEEHDLRQGFQGFDPLRGRHREAGQKVPTWDLVGEPFFSRRQPTARVGKQKPPRSEPRGLRRFSPELRAFRALRVLRRRSRACSQRAPSDLDERRVGQLSRSLSCPVGREKPRGV